MIDEDELKDIAIAMDSERSESTSRLHANKTFSQVPPCSPAKVLSAAMHSPLSSAEFHAMKRKEMDDRRNLIQMQLKELQELWPPQRKCRAFEDVKKLKSEFDVLTRNTKDAEFRLKVADSILDEAKAVLKRRTLLTEQLQLLL